MSDTPVEKNTKSNNRNFLIPVVIFLFWTMFSCHASGPSDWIVGEWVEVRQESRLGYVYNNTSGMMLNTPSIELTFQKNNFGTFYNPEIPEELEPKATMPYILYGDSDLVFGRYYEVYKITPDTLILIHGFLGKKKAFKSDNDTKSIFIRKKVYDQLSETEKQKAKGPTEKDIKYRDSCIAVREKDRYDRNAFYPGDWHGSEVYFHDCIKLMEPLDNCKGDINMTAWVDVDGNLYDIEIVKSDCPAWNEVVIDLAKKMGKWRPAIKDRQFVPGRVFFYAPINKVHLID